MKKLFESLSRRLRPEDVAEIVLQVLKGKLDATEKSLLDQVAKGSLSRNVCHLSSMMQDFRQPIAPEKQVKKAQELFKTACEVDATDAEAVLKFVKKICREIKKTFTESDFLKNRLNREQRHKKGLDISKRRYNKLFRFLGRFEDKLNVYVLEQRKYEATLISKSSLASKIVQKDFSASKDAACFIAYFTARCNRRSEFTNKSQDKPFDDVSKMLLDRFKKNSCREGWRAIAHVMPDIEVVENLDDKDKIQLYAMWLKILANVADLLKQTWEASKFDRTTMIVHRGDDSSTWNALAGAWNTARKNFISLTFALGAEKNLDKVCFGKVLRLMAADVAHWHRSSGGNLEPDTQVWANLPAPWDVFSGEAECSKKKVQSVCDKFGIDAVKKGWIAPVQNRKTVEFKPTPELVHGVVVSNPELAIVLKKAGWFSGKYATAVNYDVNVVRDEFGYAKEAVSM